MFTNDSLTSELFLSKFANCSQQMSILDINQRQKWLKVKSLCTFKLQKTHQNCSYKLPAREFFPEKNSTLFLRNSTTPLISLWLKKFLWGNESKTNCFYALHKIYDLFSLEFVIKYIFIMCMLNIHIILFSFYFIKKKETDKNKIKSTLTWLRQAMSKKTIVWFIFRERHRP